ncbi:MAG: HsdM family class I SAM-dependent methyltransferase, partial [Candidatus Thorarchaeota archaeon]
MVRRDNMQRSIRRVVRIRDSLSEELGGSHDDILHSNLIIQQQVFLRIFRELIGAASDSHGHRDLGLFTDSEIGRRADLTSTSRDYSELLQDIEFDWNHDETILDQRILFLGWVFEALKSQARRKRRGVYYTPFTLASIISNLSLDAFESQFNDAKGSRLVNLKVLDNACGSGTFLFAILNALLTRIAERATTVVLDGERVNATKHDVIATYLVANSLFGQDLDEAAINIAEAQLWLALYRLAGTRPSITVSTNLQATDTLVSSEGSDNYDIIIGNPPYMRLTSKDEEYKQVIKKLFATSREYNTHALFTQASLKHLKRGGILGYLIHKNLLTLDTFSSLRRSLIDYHQLVHLSDCGPGIFKGVTAETAVLVLKKGPSNTPESVTLSNYSPGRADCRVTSVVDSEVYNSLISPWNHRFLL